MQKVRQLLVAISSMALTAGLLVGFGASSAQAAPDYGPYLESLSVTDATLDPSFDPEVFEYGTAVDGETAIVNFTPVQEDAVITFNGEVLDQGVTSQVVDLQCGDNLTGIRVRTEDPVSDERDYFVNISRACPEPPNTPYAPDVIPVPNPDNPGGILLPLVRVKPDVRGATATSYRSFAFRSNNSQAGSCDAAEVGGNWECRIAGLDPTLPYTFRSEATGDGGTSARSPATGPIIPGPPAKPTIPVVQSVGVGTVTIKTGTSAATLGVVRDYIVQAIDSNDEPQRFCVVPAATVNTPCTITNLNPSELYTFVTRAVGEYGEISSDQTSPAIYANVVPETPQAPIAAATGVGEVTVQGFALLPPPTDDTTYEYQAFEGGTLVSGKSCTGTLVSPLTCSITGLNANTQYVFKARAVNSAGPGPWSDSSSAIVANVPAMPGQPTVEKDPDIEGNVTVTIVPATDLGGSVDEYLVQAYKDGIADGNPTEQLVADGLEVEFSGLDTSAVYTFTVVARNGVGDSAASEPSDEVSWATLPDTPGVPILQVAAAGVIDVTVVPAGSGSPVNSYSTQAFLGDQIVVGSLCSPVLPDLTCQITGLIPGQQYTFVTTATNDGGSAESAVSAPIDPGPPAVPSEPSVTVDEVGKVTATVTATENNTATGYLITATNSLDSGDVQTCALTSDPLPDPLACQIANLNPNALYRVTIVASNAAGVSQPSAAASVLANMVPGTPPAPSPVVAVGTGKIRVTIVPPTVDDTHGAARGYGVTAFYKGGGSVDGQYCSVNVNPDHLPTVCEFTGLDPTQEYEFISYPVNNIGWGAAASPRSNSVLANAAPGPLAAPTAKAIDEGVIEVTITPPTTGGTPSNYSVQAFLNGELQADRVCSATPQGDDPISCIVEELDPTLEYSFVATASNAIAPASVSPSSSPVKANVAPNSPGIPVAVLTGPGSVDVTITPAEAGVLPTSYQIYAILDGEVDDGCVITDLAQPLTCAFEDLDQSGSYTFRATASNYVGPSALTDPSQPIVPGRPGTPGKPTTHVTSDGDVKVTVVPPSDGGEPESYTVTPTPADGVSPESCEITLPDGELDSCIFAGLDSDVEYMFEVVASNVAGSSDPAQSDPVDVGAPTQPLAPKVTLAGPGAGIVDVEVIPASDEGRVTKYVVTPAGGVGASPCEISPINGEWPDPLACKFTGLIPSSSYTFTVVAFNDDRGSQPSNASTGIVPNVPAKVGKPTAAVTGLGKARVTFAPLVVAGTGAPEKYVVTAIPSPVEGSLDCDVEKVAGAWPNPLTCEVEGLVPSTEYQFEVVAQNAAGDSDLSDLSNKVTAEAPDTPGVPTAEATNVGEVKVTVTPALSGGTPNSYTIMPSPSGDVAPCVVQANQTPLSCQFTGLEKDTAYTFTVSATNVVDTSAASEPSDPSVYPNVEPAEPAKPSVVLTGEGEVTVSVAPNSGSGVDEYTLQAFEDGEEVTCPIDDCTIPAMPTPLKWDLTGLSSTTEYTFKVLAKNSAGSSDPSVASAPIVPGKPGSPGTPVAEVSGKGRVNVKVEPSLDGGPVATYTVQALDSNGDPVTGKTCTMPASADPLACEISGLDPVADYTFEVTATNVVGTSTASSESNQVTPNTAPDTPGTPTTKVTGLGEVTVTVTPSETGGQPTKYIVTAMDDEENDAGTCSIDLPTNKLECPIDGLDPAKPYRFKAAAENSVNISSDSAESDPVIPGVPGTPGKPTAKPAGPGDVEVTVIPSTGGGPTASYVVTSEPGGKTCTVVASVNPLRCVVKGLTPGGTYTFTVVAKNGAGTSTMSVASGSVKAGEAAIKLPNKPAKESIKGKPTAKKFVVSWSKPKGTNARRPVVGYRLTVKLRGQKKILIVKSLNKNRTSYTLTRKQLLRAVKQLRTVRGEYGPSRYIFSVSVQAKNSAGFSKASTSKLIMNVK
ncbi:MAG: fibronectin type III domain-containing protein [Candidatus Nanopelagicales bacterium]